MHFSWVLQCSENLGEMGTGDLWHSISSSNGAGEGGFWDLFFSVYLSFLGLFSQSPVQAKVMLREQPAYQQEINKNLPPCSACSCPLPAPILTPGTHLLHSSGPGSSLWPEVLDGAWDLDSQRRVSPGSGQLGCCLVPSYQVAVPRGVQGNG